MPISLTAASAEICEHSSTFAIELLQKICPIGSKHHMVPHQHDHIEIILISKGKGCITIGSKKHGMEDNMLYCILPGQLHHLAMDGTMHGYIISFPIHLANSGNDDFDLIYRSVLFDLLESNPRIHLSMESIREINAISQRLFKEFHGGNFLRKEILKRYTGILLIYLARLFETAFQMSPERKGVVLVKNFVALVEKKFTTWKLVKEYARELSVSPNYLNEIVKRVSGQSAGHYIRQRIVLEARNKAIHTDASMKEIAYDLGFDDAAHFSKFFKTMNGRNFTEFRKKL